MHRPPVTISHPAAQLATKLDAACEQFRSDMPLRVFVQVNTSGEESKSGVEPEEVVALVQHVLSCRNLRFVGLMTIGMPDYSSRPENFEVCWAFVGGYAVITARTVFAAMPATGA